MMTWLRIDDGFVEHPKVYDLSDRAFRLHVAALCYSARNLTDGILDERRIAVLCAITKATQRHIRELIDAELWLFETEDHYEIRDYLDYNPDAETVKKRRDEAKERMANLRSSRERLREQTAHVRTPRPVPSPTRPKEQDPKSIARMDDILLVTARWTANAPPLIVHRETYLRASKTSSAVEVALRTYPAKDVAAAVENYATVLAGVEFRWDHRWPLVLFLKRGLDRFVPEAEPLENFRIRAENGRNGHDAGQSARLLAELYAETTP